MKRFMVVSLLSCLAMGQINCDQLPERTGQKKVSNIDSIAVYAGMLGAAASMGGLIKAVSSSPASAGSLLAGGTAIFGCLAAFTRFSNNISLGTKYQNDSQIDLKNSDTYPTINKIGRVATGLFTGCAIGSFLTLPALSVYAEINRCMYR